MSTAAAVNGIAALKNNPKSASIFDFMSLPMIVGATS
jgi:hypothetical protein